MNSNTTLSIDKIKSVYYSCLFEPHCDLELERIS